MVNASATAPRSVKANLLSPTSTARSEAVRFVRRIRLCGKHEEDGESTGSLTRPPYRSPASTRRRTVAQPADLSGSDPCANEAAREHARALLNDQITPVSSPR